jgi:hypothetical protein
MSGSAQFPRSGVWGHSLELTDDENEWGAATITGWLAAFVHLLAH